MSEKQSKPLTFMAVHAHPDDEVFGTGGTFALLTDQGVHTVLVTATMGEEGEIVDPALDEQAREAMFPRLAEVREQELKASVEALHIQELRLLRYRDSGMAGRPSNNHPEAFHTAIFDEAVKKLVALIRELKPQIMVTYDPFGSYGHPDHLQAQRITSVAFEAAAEPRLFPELGLPVWQVSKLYYMAMPRSFFARAIEEARKSGEEAPFGASDVDINTMGTPDELVTTRIDVRPYLQNKLNAFRAHKTQIAPDNFFFKMPAEQLEQGFGYEYFILARSAATPHTGEFEHDLLDSLAEKSL
jgi:N-acetyl-1-D-myo-inositol-2-amino-2-deoxy-alpha-D-glucopyranoside deacetylase